ncbi:MAG: hypothetical protein P8Y15_06920 [Gemmatimonadales bacterium]
MNGQACQQSVRSTHHIFAAHGHARISAGKGSGQRRDLFYRYAGDGRDLLRSVVAGYAGPVTGPQPALLIGEILESGEVVGHELRVVQLVSDQHVGNPEGEDGMRSRPNCHPLVRARRRPREARIHLDESRAPTIRTLGIGIRHESLQGGPPRFEERSAEGEHEPAAFKVVARPATNSVHDLHDRVGAVGILVGHVVR